MADIVLKQALTDQQQKAVKRIDLDCAVRGLDKYSVEKSHLYGVDFVFKYGMPGKFPAGEFGGYVTGDSGIHERPVPAPLDHRTSFRYGEIPLHEFKLGGLFTVVAPMTLYPEQGGMYMENPTMGQAIHVQSVAKVLPKYMKYLAYKLFIGTTRKNEKGYDKEYFENYIEPSDGNTNGYKFYLSEGYGEINLQKIVNKQKVTTHTLKTLLEKINGALYSESRKKEVEGKKDETFKNREGINDNLPEAQQKFLHLGLSTIKEVDEILYNEQFDKKYKHKGIKADRSGENDSETLEGFNMPVSSDNLVVIINSRDGADLERAFLLVQPFVTAPKLTDMPCQVIQSHLLDSNQMLIMDKRLLRVDVMPQYSKYMQIPYRNERTIDIFYEMAHTVALVPTFGSMGMKLK